ncbi:MAG: GNAT family N-acetyltransferase [Oligoflexia bacterium]|nr:GNAT family N-acetyltransferase [Oligoflexia bacterium]
MLNNKGFDEWAQTYDENLKEDKFPFFGYKKVLFSLIELIKPTKDLTILDVGIGTGTLASDLAQNGCLIYGIDFSKEMLEKAKSKIPNGIFEQVDISKEYLGSFSNQKFDRIISSYFFHHLDTNQKIDFIQKAIKNNLNANGMIIIADVGFESKQEYESAQINFKNNWDEDEHYLCAEELTQKLNDKGIEINYQQISACAGILCYKNENTIQGQKIYLRKPLKEELSFIKWLWADTLSMKEVGGPIVMTDEKFLKWYEKMVYPGSEKNHYCIIFSKNDQPIGEISCHNIDRANGTANFNIKIAYQFRGQGYAKEAMIIFLRHFFLNMNGKCMFDDIAIDNLVSQKLFLKFGFEQIFERKDAIGLKLTREIFLKLYGN